MWIAACCGDGDAVQALGVHVEHDPGDTVPVGLASGLLRRADGR